MNEAKLYDAAIIGGGLAGLSTAILLAKKGFSVILFEKETYPSHKVCGEYISMESWNFISTDLGIPLNTMNLPLIKNLLLTSPEGKEIKTVLPLGGFGISRYKIDNELKNAAKQHGVILKENCKIDNLVHIAHGVVVGRNALVIALAIVAGSVEIGENAWIAPSSSILQKVKIGKNATIGMGAVVLKDVGENETWVGNPAKRLMPKE